MPVLLKPRSEQANVCTASARSPSRETQGTEDFMATIVTNGSGIHNYNNRYKGLRCHCLYSNSRCEVSQKEVEKVLTCYM